MPFSKLMIVPPMALAFALAACSEKEETAVTAAAPDAVTPGAEPATAPTPVADEPVTAAIADTDGEPAKEKADDKPATADKAAPAGKPANEAALEKPATPEPAKMAGPPPAFAICKTCHAVEPGKNGIGPSLAGVAGRKAGSVAGYSYSTALKDSGVTWTDANLDKWLAGPFKMVPGTKMVTAVPNAESRKAIIDYMKTL